MKADKAKCLITPATPLVVDGPVTKLARKFVQTVAPTQARVRYDVEHRKWAVLDSENKVKRHFEYGVMTDVTLEVIVVKPGHAGCGDRESIGVASGKLQENTYGTATGQPQNLWFDGDHFMGVGQLIITKLDQLTFMPDRRSVYYQK